MDDHCKAGGCYMFAPHTDARTECERACRLERSHRERAERLDANRAIAHVLRLLTSGRRP